MPPARDLLPSSQKCRGESFPSNGIKQGNNLLEEALGKLGMALEVGSVPVPTDGLTLGSQAFSTCRSSPGVARREGRLLPCSFHADFLPSFLQLQLQRLAPAWVSPEPQEGTDGQSCRVTGSCFLRGSCCTRYGAVVIWGLPKQLWSLWSHLWSERRPCLAQSCFPVVPAVPEFVWTELGDTARSPLPPFPLISTAMCCPFDCAAVHGHGLHPSPEVQGYQVLV